MIIDKTPVIEEAQHLNAIMTMTNANFLKHLETCNQCVDALEKDKERERDYEADIFSGL
jgi:hypothetical protein